MVPFTIYWYMSPGTGCQSGSTLLNSTYSVSGLLDLSLVTETVLVLYMAWSAFSCLVNETWASLLLTYLRESGVSVCLCYRFPSLEALRYCVICPDSSILFINRLSFIILFLVGLNDTFLAFRSSV